MAEAERKLAAILSADVVGYSRLMAEDEAATITTLRAYREQIGVLVREHRGRVVDAPGDNVLAEFPTALDAVCCAVEIQGVLRARNASLPTERHMDFRIGVHMGDVAVEEGRVYGDGVNIAARLEALAEAGGICISAMVREQVRNKLDVGYVDLGDQTIKNIPDQVHVYRIQPRSEPEEPARGSGLRAKRRSRLRGALIAAAGVLLLLGAGLWASWPRPLGLLIDLAGVSGPPVGPQVSDKPAIAVLPFVNMSGDPEQEHFADGVAEEIITKLTRFRELLVLARNSTFQYKGRAVDVTQVGRELGVGYVLEGSIRRDEDSIRVTVQLLDAGNGAHLWAETYERDVTTADLFDLQDAITEQVVATIAGEFGIISRAVLEKEEKTGTLSAYGCVLWTRAHYWRTFARDQHLWARDCLERALEREPGSAEEWAALAWLTLDEERAGFNPRPGALDRALDAAQRAVEIDPTNSNAHQALANVHFHRHEIDLFWVEAERAIALNPNDPDTLAEMGTSMAHAGDWERGLRLTRKAVALSPAPPGWFYAVFFEDHYRRGEYREALAQAQKMKMPEYFWSHLKLAMAYAQLGRQEEARASLTEVQRTYPGFTMENAVHVFRSNNYSDDLIERCLDGLRKAGLPE